MNDDRPQCSRNLHPMATDDGEEETAVSALQAAMDAQGYEQPDGNEAEGNTADPNEICTQTILRLMAHPHKMCELLGLKNATRNLDVTKRPKKKSPLPELFVSTQRVLGNPELLQQIEDQFAGFSDNEIYGLRSLFSQSKKIDAIIESFMIHMASDKSSEQLKRIANFMERLCAEVSPSRFRTDRFLNMTPQELTKAEQKLPPFEGDYNHKDWPSICSDFVRGGLYRIFDNSNITLSEVLKELGAEYREKIYRDRLQLEERAENFRVSDSHFQRAYTYADTPDYHKIYKFLSNLVGCRFIKDKELEKTDAAVVMSIFQEMEELIVTNFDMFGRQLALLKPQIAEDEPVPKTGFSKENVNDIEANSFQFPDQWKNLYEIEMKRRTMRDNGAAAAAMPPPEPVASNSSNVAATPVELTTTTMMEAEEEPGPSHAKKRRTEA